MHSWDHGNAAGRKVLMSATYAAPLDPAPVALRSRDRRRLGEMAHLRARVIA